MPLRPAPLVAVALAALPAAPAAAQTAFRLVDPVVVVDGRRYDRPGARVEQADFRFFVLTVPTGERLVVADRPFPGARRAGDFDGDVLALTVDGRSVRVRAAEPILSARGVVPAYARFDGGRGTIGRAGGLAFAVTGEAPALDAVAGTREVRATGRGLSTDPAVLADARRNTDRVRQDRERDVLDAERARLAAERNALTAETERLRAELARLRAERERQAAALDSLRRAVSAGGAEAARAADRAAADVAALRAEVDRLDAELARARAAQGGWSGAGATDATGTVTNSGRAPAGGPGVNTPTAGPGPLDQPFTEGRLAISLPGFDHARLRNVDEVRAVMAGALLPVAALEGRGSGDVIVMFVTDTEGNVVRTELAAPVAPEVDAVAERIVRAMRIVPPTVAGQPAVLRSQVRVRFSR